ncbi:EamA/RhaT family transporter, partial [Klebsiella pneumoniae]|nr:EamA/RhaT family transporter [Klebsiella pneumoniae]
MSARPVALSGTPESSLARTGILLMLLGMLMFALND